MKSCRILFAAINARYTHSNPALLYLRKSIEDLDFHASVVEFSSAETESRITERIKSFRPEVLALSVYIWNTLKVKKLLKILKAELPGIIIVLGGPEVSFNAEDWTGSFDEIDYIITGGGENSFRKLALSGFTLHSRIIAGSNPHFSLIEFPYNDEDMKMLSGRYLYYESSRGCPFKCTYCLSSESETIVEFRTIDQVRDELGFFSAYDPFLVKFIDRTFNIKREHFMPVWEYILKNFTGLKTRFHFEIFPELLDSDDLELLKNVPHGLFQFEMGIQSANPETLQEINRSGSWERIEANIRSLVSMGNIHLHTDLIAGLPFEKYSDFSRSFNRVYSLGADHLQAGFLKILPGTEMFRRAGLYRMKYNDLPPYEVIENKWITRRDMERLKNIGGLVDLVFNSGRFHETEKLMVSLYGSAFAFYERAEAVFRKEKNASHRHWEFLAGFFIDIINADFEEKVPLLIDCLRWDWCSAMKAHHYPGILKSDLTVQAKREGFRFFIERSENKVINFKGSAFLLNDLRRSIFFLPQTDAFSEKMKDKMALFLPDRRIVFFNPEISE